MGIKKQDIWRALKAARDKNGEVAPTSPEYAATGSTPTLQQIYTVYPTWPEAWADLGVDYHADRVRYRRDTTLRTLGACARAAGTRATEVRYRQYDLWAAQHGHPRAYTVTRHHGSWPRAQEQCARKGYDR